MSYRVVMMCCAVLGTLSVAGATFPGLGLLQVQSEVHGDKARAHVADDSGVQKGTRKEVQHRSIIVQDVQADQKMVICNAYTSPKPITIVLVRTGQKLTEGSPMNYKQCKEFTVPLKEGDQFDFKSGGLDIGTFYATGLPTATTTLLLIPHRRTPHAVGVTFESHAFTMVKSPQIAVIDAYQGRSDNQAGSPGVKIMEKLPAAGFEADKTRVEEELKLNSVVAVNPGSYDVSIAGVAGMHGAALALNVVGADNYVIMRLGDETEGAEGMRYPQELVVFPNCALQSAMRFSVTVVVGLAAFLGFGLHGIN